MIQIDCLHTAISHASVQELLGATTDTTVATKAMYTNELEHAIVDSRVREKAMAFSTDSRLLEIARHEIVAVERSANIARKRVFDHEGRCFAGVPAAHARMPIRISGCAAYSKCQCTLLDIVLREA